MGKDIIVSKVLDQKKACESIISDYERSKKFMDVEKLRFEVEYYKGYLLAVNDFLAFLEPLQDELNKLGDGKPLMG